MAGVEYIQQCDVSEQCKNSIARLDFGSGKCGICRLSPNGPEGGTIFWAPITPGMKHPILVQIKKQAAKDRSAAVLDKKKNANQAKRTILKKAGRAEKQTERNLIRSTKNSGRSNKDGDHVAGNEITLDTKLQTKRENPVVLMHELVKVGEDARRAGNWMGALVLRNTHGVGVVAMAEADFARLMQRIA